MEYKRVQLSANSCMYVPLVPFSTRSSESGRYQMERFICGDEDLEIHHLEVDDISRLILVE